MSVQEQIIIVTRAIESAHAWIAGPARGAFLPVAPELLVAARRVIGSEGKEAMAPFVEWLIMEEGMTDDTAKNYGANVWQAVIATGGQPVKQVERADLTVSTKNSIRASLRHFAVFANDGNLAAELENKRVKRLLRDRKHSKASKTVMPLDEETVKKLMTAINADKGNPRRPWAWPCLSMMVKLGLRARADMGTGVTREAVVDSVTRGAPLAIIGKRGTRRVVPSSIVAEELKILSQFPFEWNNLSDLIAPGASIEGRSQAAYAKIRATIREYAESAGIDPNEIRSHRLRHTAATRLYEASGHDIMLVAGFLGHASIETTRQYLEKDRTDELEKHLSSLDYGEDE